MRWYLAVLKNYVGFSGRSRRKEFWMFTLVSVIISIVLTIIDNLIGTDTGTTRGGVGYTSNAGLLSGLYGLAVLLPSLAVQFRRLHDTNRRGWWILIALIPVIGGIVLLIFNVLPGDGGPNRFGGDPKTVGPEGPAPATA